VFSWSFGFGLPTGSFARASTLGRRIIVLFVFLRLFLLRCFQATLGRLDLRQMIFTSLQFRWQLITSEVRGVAGSHWKPNGDRRIS